MNNPKIAHWEKVGGLVKYFNGKSIEDKGFTKYQCSHCKEGHITCLSYEKPYEALDTCPVCNYSMSEEKPKIQVYAEYLKDQFKLEQEKLKRTHGLTKKSGSFIALQNACNTIDKSWPNFVEPKKEPVELKKEPTKSWVVCGMFDDFLRCPHCQSEYVAERVQYEEWAGCPKCLKPVKFI